MKRLLAAMGLAFVLAFFATPAPVTAQVADPTVTLVGSDIVVSIAGREIARVPAPVKTVKVEVPVQGPVREVIKVVETPVPGPVQTVLVPGPVRTVPGPTRTVFVQPDGSTRTQEPSPVNSPGGQNSTPRATLTPEPVPSPTPDAQEMDRRDDVIIERETAAGISAGLIALGVLVTLAAIALTRYLTRRKLKRQEVENLSQLKDDLFSKE